MRKTLDLALQANLQEELTDEDLAKPPGKLPDEDREKVHDANHWNVSDLLRSPLQRTMSWGKTLETSSNSTTTNWSVNDLLTSALQRTLAWEKTLKTSRATTTRRRRRTLTWEKTLWTSKTRNWNVNGLLQKKKDRRHIPQLFHHLRLTKNRPGRTG